LSFVHHVRQRGGLSMPVPNLGIWVLSAAFHVMAGATADLNQAERQVVESAFAAHQRGDPVTLLETLSPLVAKIDDKKLSAVDELLASRGSPSAGEMIADARLAMVQQSLSSKLPRPGPRETLLVLKAIDSQAQAILEIMEAHPAMADPMAVPDTSTNFELRLWELHVLRSRLEVARRMIEYMGTLAKSYPRVQFTKLSEDDRRLVEVGAAGLQSRIARELSGLEEREAELRIHRLIFSVGVLQDAQLTEERVLAAFASEFDGRLVKEFFDQAKKSRRNLSRDLLNDPTTEGRVVNERRRARELAGDLTVKAQLLFEGLHWWMRGRYGRGPEVGGLAKSLLAMRTPQGQLGLYMPIDIPTPTDQAAGPSQRVPAYDRRHHYLWAMEDRRVLEHVPAASCGSTKIDFW
jgi:hypothetical protein